MARFRLPSQLISVLSEELSRWETHASMNKLFSYAKAPGDPPEGSKLTKAQDWLRRINTDESCDPLEVVGLLIEGYMEPPLLENSENPFPSEEEVLLIENQEKR